MLATFALAQNLDATTNEQVVVDRHTGLAISGYDPVAYFEKRPQEGKPEFELPYAGAIWRFRNEGNRDAFARDPGIYMPRYGGYDPVSVGHGASAPGFPDIWLVIDERLYLFREPAHREAFRKNPASMIDTADRHWPSLLRTLAR